MSDRKYTLTIVRDEPNPKYNPTPNEYYRGPSDTLNERLQTREVSATITEEELDIIKQALLKVWK